MQRIVPVIVCGGFGSRLWPASRASYPKQFLPLLGRSSSFRDALHRLDDPEQFSPPVIVTGEPHRFLVLHELDAVGMAGEVLIEPEQRDSGPAILAAAMRAARDDREAVLLMLAADHVVSEVDLFRKDCAEAARAAAGSIVTFGVPPDRPSTDFGYIQPGALLDGFGTVRKVERFVEKPDAERAAALVGDGCFWNSGNFCFKASTLIEEYRRFDAPTVEAVGEAVKAARRDFRFLRLGEAAYRRANRLSIDYAVMERTSRAAMLPARFQWSDIGSWRALWELGDRDARGNVVNGAVSLRDVHGSYIDSTDGVLVAAIGLRDTIVVARKDAVLVAARERAAEVKDLVEQLRRDGLSQANEAPRVHRPWGWYQTLDSGHRFQVKRLVVHPGGKLSLQKHMHRAEHWVVVKGTALVAIGSELRLVHENQSTYIPVGEVHRLENPGRIDLEVVEVQSGSYTGEDDIVRMADGDDRTADSD